MNIKKYTKEEFLKAAEIGEVSIIDARMASDGLSKRAKKGTCRICQRSRCTADKVKAVGEVRHGFATGHIWECKDVDDCNKAAEERRRNWRLSGNVRAKIEIGLERGRFKEYTVIA